MNSDKSLAWHQKRPIVGLAPMDGYTDYPFRETISHYGSPDVVFTEFVPASGLIKKSTAFEQELIFDKNSTPVVMQLFGSIPEHFNKAIKFLSDRGFAGFDINMGCPAKNVNHVGAGASLIGNPELAKEIILASREALPINTPLSVKTRLGIYKDEIETWLKVLASSPVDAITLHGRTLKQGYSGHADWNAISRGCEIVKSINNKITFLGNGDISSLNQAYEYIEKYKVDGVLAGRHTFGNPWFFSNHIPTIKEKAEAAIYQAEKMQSTNNANVFIRLRKHLIHYFKGTNCASEIRSELAQVHNASEVKTIISKYINKF